MEKEAVFQVWMFFQQKPDYCLSKACCIRQSVQREGYLLHRIMVKGGWLTAVFGRDLWLDLLLLCFSHL
jgi:hypothetical protein